MDISNLFFFFFRRSGHEKYSFTLSISESRQLWALIFIGVKG
jgi:hypothetical protein